MFGFFKRSDYRRRKREAQIRNFQLYAQTKPMQFFEEKKTKNVFKKLKNWFKGIKQCQSSTEIIVEERENKVFDPNFEIDESQYQKNVDLFTKISPQYSSMSKIKFNENNQTSDLFLGVELEPYWGPGTFVVCEQYNRLWKATVINVKEEDSEDPIYVIRFNGWSRFHDEEIPHSQSFNRIFEPTEENLAKVAKREKFSKGDKH